MTSSTTHTTEWLTEQFQYVLTREAVDSLLEDSVEYDVGENGVHRADVLNRLGAKWSVFVQRYPLPEIVLIWKSNDSYDPDEPTRRCIATFLPREDGDHTIHFIAKVDEVDFQEITDIVCDMNGGT